MDVQEQIGEIHEAVQQIVVDVAVLKERVPDGLKGGLERLRADSHKPPCPVARANERRFWAFLLGGFLLAVGWLWDALNRRL